jgi:gamma-glutamyltranspeptidase/glutathione hydrolase
VPVEELLSKDYAAERAKLIDMQRAARSVDPGNPMVDHGDTTFLVAADSNGMLVSLIQSNYTGFGSGHAVPAVGIGIQDRGALFTLDPDHPNALEPGKRPFHTIIPAFMGRNGVPDTAFGLMGGGMQPQGHVQIVVNLVDFGMNVQEAGDAPRFHHGGSSEPTGTVMTSGGAGEAGPPPAGAGGPELRRLPGRRPRPRDRGAVGGHREPQGRLRRGVLTAKTADGNR